MRDKNGAEVRVGDKIRCPNACEHHVERIHRRDDEEFVVISGGGREQYLGKYLGVEVISAAPAPYEPAMRRKAMHEHAKGLCAELDVPLVKTAADPANGTYTVFVGPGVTREQKNWIAVGMRALLPSTIAPFVESELPRLVVPHAPPLTYPIDACASRGELDRLLDAAAIGCQVPRHMLDPFAGINVAGGTPWQPIPKPCSRCGKPNGSGLDLCAPCNEIANAASMREHGRLVAQRYAAFRETVERVVREEAPNARVVTDMTTATILGERPAQFIVDFAWGQYRRQWAHDFDAPVAQFQTSIRQHCECAIREAGERAMGKR